MDAYRTRQLKNFSGFRKWSASKMERQKIDDRQLQARALLVLNFQVHSTRVSARLLVLHRPRHYRVLAIRIQHVSSGRVR